MSSYFDALNLEVDEANFDHEEDEDFLRELAGIEFRVFGEVTRITGDIEYPSDHRERILGIFAVHSVRQAAGYPRNEKAEKLAVLLRYSRCIEDLHNAFHDVARARINTRFGLLSDDPVGDCARRDEEDAGR